MPFFRFAAIRLSLTGDHDKYRRALHGTGIRLTTNKIPAWTYLSSRASRPA